jgi:ribonuclease P protein component
MIATASRLRKHADYQTVYNNGRRQPGRQILCFFLLRPAAAGTPSPDLAASSASRTPRVGLTVGKAAGNAVVRNRIKRRMRAAIRKHLALLPPAVDVILHPRPSILDLAFPTLEDEVASVFRAVVRAAERRPASPTA